VPDVVTLARTARESLALGLNALQADPRVPPHLVDLAAPIAQAMGALHRIESTGGAQLVQNAQAALTSVQVALGALQAQPPTQQAVVLAMEAVAGALGSVHALVRAGQTQPTAPPAAPAPAPAAPRAPQAYAPPQQAYAAPGPPAPAPQPPPPAQQAYQPPQQAYQPPQNSYQAQAYAPTAQAPAQPQRPPSPAVPAGELDVVAAELGAHSPSNFYKGLSGNDIVDHGGVFISTYKLPQLGHPVRVRVSLPGGYEFEANAVVRWRREPSDSGSDAPPGFGAQFTEITPEARQLVYRYVRNREPMFHDDL
jgi:outer membrane biosynthesis protein TonB